jgi:hypothetical protein
MGVVAVMGLVLVAGLARATGLLERPQGADARPSAAAPAERGVEIASVAKRRSGKVAAPAPHGPSNIPATVALLMLVGAGPKRR